MLSVKCHRFLSTDEAGKAHARAEGYTFINTLDVLVGPAFIHGSRKIEEIIRTFRSPDLKPGVMDAVRELLLEDHGDRLALDRRVSPDVRRRLRLRSIDSVMDDPAAQTWCVSTTLAPIAILVIRLRYPALHIEYLGVEKNWRRRNIARNLIAHAVNPLGLNGVIPVLQAGVAHDNKEALAFYASIGMRKVYSLATYHEHIEQPEGDGN